MQLVHCRCGERTRVWRCSVLVLCVCHCCRIRRTSEVVVWKYSPSYRGSSRPHNLPDMATPTYVTIHQHPAHDSLFSDWLIGAHPLPRSFGFHAPVWALWGVGKGNPYNFLPRLSSPFNLIFWRRNWSCVRDSLNSYCDQFLSCVYAAWLSYLVVSSISPSCDRLLRVSHYSSTSFHRRVLLSRCDTSPKNSVQAIFVCDDFSTWHSNEVERFFLMSIKYVFSMTQVKIETIFVVQCNCEQPTWFYAKLNWSMYIQKAYYHRIVFWGLA